jgi:hypothetical protein
MRKTCISVDQTCSATGCAYATGSITDPDSAHVRGRRTTAQTLRLRFVAVGLWKAAVPPALETGLN